ncbi:aspartyl protease family protein At5g10770-like isoform X1 [Panicum virgatum]|uniref:Peptidase A1 domain-containing protein n=1 Tax=Panicum virgatum TaxID=38727 RepID=A0A8T0T293_PANVG|nr:aspartyl protease family protein At5g10770-like isoform X1 [Panicum virgatum]KAG2605822.1 hypothetical protein PVAP13_4NG144800 [Panicum virgatum]
MASPLLPLLVLLLGGCCCSIAHGADAQRYLVVAPSSLKPSETCSGPKVSPSKNGATLPLTHRHGPCSPSISKEKPSLEETLRRDQHRAAYIHAKVSGNGTKEALQQSAVTITTSPGFSLGTAEYVVTVGVGTPAMSQVVSIDTGSDVSWVQCAPCPVRSCYSQKDMLFDPAKSSTYAAFSCGSTQCAQLGGEGNGCLNSQCQYMVRYADNSNTTGTYGSDTLTLTSSDVVKSFQFGCSHRAAGFVGQMDGLMGLGGDAESLVSQTAATYGKAFSYCLPRPSSSAGFLTLGAAGGAAGFARTPMARFRNTPTFYGVFPQAITVAGAQLDVPASVFSGASIVDSGTVITRLPPTAYRALRAAFRKEMKAYPSAAPAGNLLDTCFDFSGFSTITVPKIALTFSRGAVMDLDISGILYGSCLAFTAMGQDGDTGILGNVQQRTFEVLYDVGGGSVGFRPGAC